ncbi:S1 RNA-binding domain-containing protein [Actinomadura welshii]|uniref:S1 RNA-binding domain-containing protein n=1 Tax=Actinomadura welshii TaxID=3103817 RepID=UPI0003AD3745|nr:S1 RNA-binding domain-containing protein [Actinomadura madurae]
MSLVQLQAQGSPDPIERLMEDLSRAMEHLQELKERFGDARPGPGQEPARIPAEITHVEREFAVVRAEDGTSGVLSGMDVQWGRIIPNMTRRFSIGERVDGAFEAVPSGGKKYTLLTGPNPWESLSLSHPVGSTLTGTVYSVVDEIGIFVRITDQINGLIPRSQLRTADVWTPGMEIEVRVMDVQPHRRHVTLALAVSIPREARPSAGAGVRLGQRLEGDVVKVAPPEEGSYLLLKVPGRLRPVLLRWSEMTAELRDDLLSGRIGLDVILDVEVVAIDAARDSVLVRDLPEDFVEDAS